MRPVVFGLVVILAGLVGVTNIAMAQRLPAAKGKAAAPAAPDPAAVKAALMGRLPAFIQKTQVQCTPTDVRQIGDGPFIRVVGEQRISTEVFEVACQEGMGYVIGAADNGETQADDCAFQIVPPGAAANPLVCTLPGNANSVAFLQPVLTKAGVTCVPEKARGIGKSATGSHIYEVGCQSGVGFILSASRGADAKFTALPCLAAAGTASKCILTTEEQNLVPAKALATKAEKPCTVTNTRYVITGAAGDYFEYQCNDDTGFMILANPAGEYVRQVLCPQAIQIGGGCTLTKVDAGQTADNALYTRLAKAAGFNCDVAKYLIYPISGSGREIVEMVCSNRPDGGVGIFPATGRAEILNCGRSQVEGVNWKCSLTPVETTYPPLSQQLADLGRSSCKVSGTRVIGKNAQAAYLEVACADGDPGWVIVYPPGVNKPDRLLTCGDAAGIGGGCQLPTNRRG